MRSHRSGVGAYVLALLLTCLLVLLVSSAQAQVSYFTWAADDTDRTFQRRLWSDLGAWPVECVIAPIELTRVQWCGGADGQLGIEAHRRIVERVADGHGLNVRGEWSVTVISDDVALHSLGFADVALTRAYTVGILAYQGSYHHVILTRIDFGP